MQGCNLNCTHCFTLGNADPRMVTDINLVSRYLSTIRNNVNPAKATFYIHGGETFLAPLSYLKQVNDTIRYYFGDRPIDIVPQTNLTYKVKEDFIKFIHDEYNSTIGVSWDADIRFDDIKQEELFFKNLKLLLSSGIKVHIAITAQRHLLNHDPIEIVKLFDGVDSIDFELLTTFDHKTDDLKPNNNLWSDWLDKLTEYYQNNQTSWCLPQVDLFTKSILSGKIYDCKCNCCDKRTFTLNPNGTVGFCPDKAYVAPVTTVDEMEADWSSVEQKALSTMAEKMDDAQKNTMCYECEHYEICGGNCESSLFDETDECPLSKKVIQRVRDNIDVFADLYKSKAKINLTELREDYEYS